MESVLTAPTKNEELVDSFVSPLSTKQTQRRKESIQSPNGNHPHASFPEPKAKILVHTLPWESEGWRYVEKPTQNGKLKYERIPLTRYELLHPKEGYHIVHRTTHDSNTAYIGTSMGTKLAGNPTARVFGDLRTDLNLSGIEPITPDNSVVFGVSKDRMWSTFNCHQEGIYPSVVFEVTSPGTRKSDFNEKYDYYCQAGIPYYVILDIIYIRENQTETAIYHLHVFELMGGQYVEVQPDHQGRCWLPSLEVWAGVGEKGILFYDADGNLLMSHEELAQALVEVENERDAEKARADEQEHLARQEATRVEEQKRLVQQESTRAAEQERIAQQESTRAAEQERIAQQERMVAQQESARAAEQERIAQEALQAQLAAEAKVAELLAQMAELQAKSP